MSKLTRILSRILKDETKTKYSVWDKVMMYYDDVFSMPDWYYNVLNYIRNFNKFNKLAWNWRDWDASYSITVFTGLLVAHAHVFKDGHLANSKKYYRRCLTAAALLSRAYSYSCLKDKGYMYLHRKYPYEFIGRQIVHSTGSNPYAERLMSMASKRVDAKEKAMKIEAWAYIHRYIDYFWD